MIVMTHFGVIAVFLIYLSTASLGDAQEQPSPPTLASDFIPVCVPDDFRPSTNDTPLPNLPDQFSFTIEGNLVERNRTVVMTEYYDGYGDRGKLEYVFNDTSGFAIFDYNLGEIFLAPDLRTGDECRVYPIADNPRILNFTFGVENRNGTLHIGSPRMFIEQLRDNAATIYVGEDMVRGIPTQRWQACFGGENISYLIDYHFAYSSWDYEGQGQNLEASEMIPLQFTLNTTRLDNGDVKNIYHIYSFVDFRAGPDSVPDSVFRVPNGLACVGRFPGQPVPPLPNFFSMYVQQTSTQPFPNIRTLREFYDLPHNLFRLDFYSNGSQEGAPGSYSIIHDFSTSLQYIVGNQIKSCTAQPLNQSAQIFFDIASGDDGDFQLVSPNNFFFLGSDYNYSYEGVSTIRGVEVDSWVSVRDFEQIAGAVNLTNAIYEVFFTRPGWIYTTDRSINSDPVPWRIKVTGTLNFRNYTGNQTFEMDFFDFSTEEPPYDAFDVSACSAPDDYYTLVLVIPGREKGVEFGQLRRNIRTSMTNYTGLRPLQIGNIQIVSENGTHIFVTFQISNLTSIADIDPSTNVTAQQAVDLLSKNTVGSQLPFQIQLSPNVTVTPSLHVAGRGPRPSCNASSCDCDVPLVNPSGTCSTPNCATPPDIPPYFSVYAQQIDWYIQPPTVATTREFFDSTHKLFRYDFFYSDPHGNYSVPLTIIHDLSSSVQYVIGNQVHFCTAQPIQQYAPYFWDVTFDDNNMIELVSPNRLFFRDDQFNYTYTGATNIRGVDVDSWVSYREFEQIAGIFNFSDAYYQVFYTRPGWNFSNVHSVTTQPVPWRIVINGTVTRLNLTDNTIVTYNTTLETDLFEFSTEEPPYDAFDVSSCSAPDDYYTLLLFIPGREQYVDFGQLRRNIRTSMSKYTGLRPLQIGNIQIVRENGTHIFVAVQLSNLTSLAKIDKTTNVTAYSAVQLLTKNAVGSQLPFQIQLSRNYSVTPSFHVTGRGPRPSSSDSSCDVPLIDPNGTCSTPNCATPPDVPSFFSTYVQQVGHSAIPPTVRTYKEFYDSDNDLYRLDILYGIELDGVAGSSRVIHDFSTSVQYIIGNEAISCLVQPLQGGAPYFWDITTSDDMPQLVPPNRLFFRDDQFNYTYTGATNIRGVDVDSWVSYREFEQITTALSLSNAYYQVFYTRPGWNFSNIHSVTTQPVPWRIVINGTVTRLNLTDNTTVTYNTTLEMDLFEFSTEEPPYDAFDVSSCSAPDDYYTLVLVIPGQEKGVEFGQLRRNIRMSMSNFTGLRPLQIGNIQIVRENKTHIFVAVQLSNLTSLANIDKATNVTAYSAVQLLTKNAVGSQLPFTIQISPGVSVAPTLHIAGRGNRCNSTGNLTCPMCNSTSNNTGGNVTNITNRLGLSSGAVAGVAIALFVLGLIVGMIAQLFCGVVTRWCRQNRDSVNFGNPFKYKHQDDDDIALD